MSADKQASILALQVIAALAAKAAEDLRRSALWPGDLLQVKDQIARALVDVKDTQACGQRSQGSGQ